MEIHRYTNAKLMGLKRGIIWIANDKSLSVLELEALYDVTVRS